MYYAKYVILYESNKLLFEELLGNRSNKNGFSSFIFCKILFKSGLDIFSIMISLILNHSKSFNVKYGCNVLQLPVATLF